MNGEGFGVTLVVVFLIVFWAKRHEDYAAVCMPSSCVSRLSLLFALGCVYALLRTRALFVVRATHGHWVFPIERKLRRRRDAWVCQE